MTETKEILISENRERGTRMVVIHKVSTTLKNRKGEPYIISETKHKVKERRNV